MDTGPGSVSDKLSAAVRGTLGDFPAYQAPGTHARVAGMLNAMQESGSVADLLAIRRQLVNTGAKGAPDNAAVSEINQVLDGYLEKSVDDVFMFGDQAAIETSNNSPAVGSDRAVFFPSWLGGSRPMAQWALRWRRKC